MQGIRRLGLLVATLAVAPSCGGHASGDEKPVEVTDTQDTRPTSFDELERCAEIGAQRAAVTGEDAKYCVCEADTVWRCYGPSPTLAPAGGANGSPPAVCNKVFVQPEMNASCLIQRSCSDNHIYTISCVNGGCFCLVDNEPTVELEPRKDCPKDVAVSNELCGWALEVDEQTGGGGPPPSP